MFHAPVLEPNFNLAFGQVQGGGDLDATRAAEIFIKVEFLLQFQQLRVGVGCPQTSRKTCISLIESKCQSEEDESIKKEEKKPTWRMAER